MSVIQDCSALVQCNVLTVVSCWRRAFNL